jgi:hypothetical protein
MTVAFTLPNREVAFDPDDIEIMSEACDDICHTRNIPDAWEHDRTIIAERIVELARRGERDPDQLRERVLREARGVECSETERAPPSRRAP